MSDLSAWTDGLARHAIEEFVAAVNTGPNAVPAIERVAVFDNDGTLWTEKPMPTQLHFIVQQWVAAVSVEDYEGSVAAFYRDAQHLTLHC